MAKPAEAPDNEKFQKEILKKMLTGNRFRGNI
jgi:hypothetical protein